MGLHFSHCTATWSYSGFDRFRWRLAAAIKVDLNTMRGYCKQGPGRRWTYEDPLDHLLNHSDCDGILTPEQCEMIGPRLMQVVKYWEPDDYDRYHAQQLALGMALAVDAGENLEFL